MQDSLNNKDDATPDTKKSISETTTDIMTENPTSTDSESGTFCD
jgi:hypothetical protein